MRIVVGKSSDSGGEERRLGISLLTRREAGERCQLVQCFAIYLRYALWRWLSVDVVDRAKRLSAQVDEPDKNSLWNLERWTLHALW